MLVAIIGLEYSMKKQMKMKPTTPQEIERDKKFHAFCTKTFLEPNLKNRLMTYPFIPFFPFKMIFSWGGAGMCWLTLSILALAFGESDPAKQGPTQRRLVALTNKITGYVVAFTSASVAWTHHVRPKVCYKKYLGPDWKPSYENAGSKVVNHSAWVDILILMQMQAPSFIAKSTVRQVPFVGKIAEIVGSLFIDRGDKDKRAALVDTISERQKLCE